MHQKKIKIFFGLIFFFVFCSLKAQNNDSIICKGNFLKDSIKQGVWLCKIGKRVIKKEKYKKGVLQTYIIFNNKGEIIETRNKKGQITKYNPCGC